MRVAFFTAGTIGAGHLVRGIAIGRALRREGVACEYAIFAPRSAMRLGDALGAVDVREVAIDPEELRDRSRVHASVLARGLRGFAPDVLIVDMFWAPLVHVLPIPGCEAWLLVRRAPAHWLVGPPGHGFDRRLFAHVIAIEPDADHGLTGETIDPIVAVNRDEVKPPRALREAIGVAAGERLVVVGQAGEAREWASLVDRDAPTVHVFTFDRDDAIDSHSPPPNARVHDGAAFFPLATWLAGADSIASGAGYNAYWEARWLGHDARTRFVPFVRTIDDQSWRVRTCVAHVMRANGADLLARRLR